MVREEQLNEFYKLNEIIYEMCHFLDSDFESEDYVRLETFVDRLHYDKVAVSNRWNKYVADWFELFCLEEQNLHINIKRKKLCDENNYISSEENMQKICELYFQFLDKQRESLDSIVGQLVNEFFIYINLGLNNTIN